MTDTSVEVHMDVRVAYLERQVADLRADLTAIREVLGQQPADKPVTMDGTGQLIAYEPRRHELLAAGWLASFRNLQTISNYRQSIKQWFGFLERNGHLDPLTASRSHVDLWMHQLELDGKAPRTINARLTAIRSFYNWCVDEEHLARSPAKRVNPPKIDRGSPRAWLTRAQLNDPVEGARHLSPDDYATVCILSFNGLRVGEFCSLDVESLAMVNGSPTITFVRKGGHSATLALSFTTYNAVLEAVGPRTTGPLLLNSKGTRHTQRSVQLILDKAVLNVRGNHGKITPHSLRHSLCSVLLAAGASHDQLMHDFGWSSGRMLQIYGHGHSNPHRSSTHLGTGLIMGMA